MKATLPMVLAAAVLVWVLSPPAGPLTEAGQAQVDARTDARATEEIERNIAKYAHSIDQADTSLASEIWLDSPDVSFIHPQGYEHGFEQIKENVYRRLMGQMFSERKLTPRDISVHVYGDAAWAEFYWDFVAKLRKDGSTITTRGRETQIYQKRPRGWRLVHVHYSGMPAAP